MTNLIVSPNIETDNLKRCTKCGEWKPATLEYFRAQKRAKSGLGAQCRDCTRAWNQRYYEENVEKISKKRRECYYANPDKEREYRRKYNRANAGKIREHRREYRRANADKIRERRREFHRMNADKIRNRVRTWRKDNPDKVRVLAVASAHGRRARKRQATGTHTAADIRAQYDSQRGKCWYCGKKVGDKYHVDHRVPLSRGGSNAPENLVVSCPACNMSKRDKLPHEWCDRLL